MRMSNQFLTAAAAAAALLFGSSAQAAMLSGAITADNAYNAYISTSDSTLGTLVASGDTWQTAQTFTTDLTAGQTYYLHVVANNLGGPGDMAGGNPDALLGSFSLSGSGFTFANGTQTLTTDATDWRASSNGVEQDLGGTPAWTAPTGVPVSFGVNGGANIWGNALGGPVSGVSTSAQWIWSASDPSGEAFFSTTLTAGGVPEPAAWALLIVGFGLTGATLRRRRALTPARVAI
ncbi:MAG TPA: PEPxxWA-CTERM sorting domain-containing protein [Phenylobacterium sp.]|uniref:PEPxxWA-CTERM sorting domain-containing protein n=1 Tax=Phenylobacterium sp. TaxID=1871053 RepID=UPI002D6BA6D5|nr:PEPxxWA-CTERM sorting domain-containing protein [Phenylobacterium sp.]HZZ67493.1 PEPxxWA-CTERM sorting domain-containing protein [Phenylobacterium sp.]